MRSPEHITIMRNHVLQKQNVSEVMITLATRTAIDFHDQRGFFTLGMRNVLTG
jgi:hypothetical protein